jgi:outer membrane protein assembly factor BamB
VSATKAGVPLSVRGGDDVNQLIYDARVNARVGVRFQDSPQWGRTGRRNNVASDDRIPRRFDVATGQNVKWSAKLGSAAFSSPVIANGKVFIGSNNATCYLKRFPARVDLGVLLCFDAMTGRFLWQHSNEKLPGGRAHDVEQTGCCCSCYVERDRLWYVNNRNDGTVVVFALSAEKTLIAELPLGTPVYNTPAVANGVLYIATSNTLYAISEGARPPPVGKGDD